MMYVSPAVGTAQVIRTSSIGASDADLSLGSSTFGADRTAALQALLDRAQTRPLHLIWDGAYSVTGLTIHGNTRITALPGCGAILRTNSNKPLLGNANPTDGAIEDENIVIEGGIWNGNGGANQSHDTETEGWIVGMRFMGVRNLTITGAIIYTARTFAVHLANWERVFISDVRVDAGEAGINSDGIHFNGPGRYAVVRDCIFHTNDDAIALNANDIETQSDGSPSVYGPYAGPGDISDVHIDNNTFDDSSFGVRLLSSTNRIDRIRITNSKGRTSKQWVLIDNYSEEPWRMGPPGEGDFGSISVEGADVQLYADGYKSAHVYVNAYVESLRLVGLHRCDWTTTIPTLKVDTGARVQSLLIENWTALPVDLPAGYSPIDQISIAGWVGVLSVRNCMFADPNASGGSVVKIQTTGKVAVGHFINNLAPGFVAVLSNAGTVTNSHTTADNFAETMPTTWALGSGVRENRFDPGWLVYTPTGGVQVAQQTANDAYSGDVTVSARVTFEAGGTGNRVAFLFARGQNMSSWGGATRDCYSLSIGTGGDLIIWSGRDGIDASEASRSVTISTGVEYRMVLTTKTAGSTVVVTGKLQRVSDGYWLNASGAWVANTDADGETAVTWTDINAAAVLTAGRCGLALYSDGGATAKVDLKHFTVSAAP